MEAVVVSQAGAEEAEPIAEMYAWLFAPPGRRPPGWTDDAGVAAIRRVIASETSVILIARRGNQRLGFCSAYADIESVRFGRRVWVEDLAVHPDHRSEGTGRLLLDAAKEWARARGAARLALDSGEARRDAHRFYEREQPTYRSFCFGWEL